MIQYQADAGERIVVDRAWQRLVRDVLRSCREHLWRRLSLLLADGVRRPFSRSAWSGWHREGCQSFYRSSGGCDRDQTTVELDDGGAIEAPGPDPVAVRGLDGGLELEPSQGRAESVGAPQ